MMKSFTKTLSVTAGAVALTFAASGAYAEQVTVHFNGFEYTPASAVTVSYSNPSGTYNGHAGQFDMTVNSASAGSPFSTGQNLLTWCVELSQNISQGNSYTYTVVRNNVGAMYDDLTKLFNKYYTAVTNAATSAAMQLAIWEIIGGDSTYDLMDGLFKETSGDATIRNTAQGWLDSLDGGAGNYSIVRLNNGNNQDLITVAVNEVPLPGAALMFLSALGLGGLARRKQRAAEPEALAA